MDTHSLHHAQQDAQKRLQLAAKEVKDIKDRLRQLEELLRVQHRDIAGLQAAQTRVNTRVDELLEWVGHMEAAFAQQIACMTARLKAAEEKYAEEKEKNAGRAWRAVVVVAVVGAVTCLLK